MQKGRVVKLGGLHGHCGRCTCSLHAPIATRTVQLRNHRASTKAAQQSRAALQQADDVAASRGASKPTTSGGWRKLRRGEAWDHSASASSPSKKPSLKRQNKDTQDSSGLPAEAGAKNGRGGQEGNEDDVGPRKSLFVRGMQQQREDSKSAAGKPQHGGSQPEKQRVTQRFSSESSAEEAFASSRDWAVWRQQRQGPRPSFPPVLKNGQSQDRDSEFAERRRAGRDEAGISGRRLGDDLAWDPPSTASTILPQPELKKFAVPIMRQEGGSTATFFTRESFQEAGASEEVVAALAKINIQRPSHIQAAAYKAMYRDSAHVVIADHAGSGKTLAYLLPLIQQIREAEKQGARTQKNRPSVLVILPTTELCVQVLRVARAVSLGGARFKSIGITGGHKFKTQRESLDMGADMVIGTPGRLFEHLKAGNLHLDNCRALVLDEVDILLGGTSAFMEQLAPLKEAAPETTRFVLVTASLPEPTWLQLQQQFYGIQPVLGPGLHRPAPGSLEQLVDCSGGEVITEETGFERKAEALLQLLKDQQVPRTIVFCNKIDTCRKVENVIKRAAKDAMVTLPYHTAIEDKVSRQRSRNLKEFLTEPLDGSRKVLVCTDQASRGVDTAHVQHVILFDFPRDPSEYVRRAGRTARGAGGSGTVSLLVLGRQVKLAKQILERNDKGLPLHRVPLA